MHSTPARLACALLIVLFAGCDKKIDPAAAAASGGQAAPAAGGGRVTVNEHGFVPTSLEVSKGGAGSTTAVTFLRTTDVTCAKEVVFPDIGLKKDLPLNVPVVVDVPSDAPRTLTFQCGMAMYKGALVIR